MGNIVVLLIIIGILAISITKVVSDKRKGVKCIGCPHGKDCSIKNNYAGGIKLKKYSIDKNI